MRDLDAPLEISEEGEAIDALGTESKEGVSEALSTLSEAMMILKG